MIQTRDAEGALRYYQTLKEAMEYANSNLSIWKVSFNCESGERVRLVRDEEDTWVYEPIMGPEVI